MARQIVLEQAEFPYHISARCINREWFMLPMEDLWWIFQEQLFFLHHAFNFRLHSFVLMNNHYHMIVSTPECNLGLGMRWFMKECSRYINKMSDRINQVWGGRYFRSLISSPHYYLHAYKYVYCNPVKANIVASVKDYKYSTLRGILGFEQTIVPVDDNTIFDMGVESCLEWLDRKPDDDYWDVVKKGLKKSTFKLANCRKTNKAHPLELELL